MAKAKIENQVEVVNRLPKIFSKDSDFLRDFIREKVKESLREGMKDLMKEAFDEFLGDKRVKEIQEERDQARKDEEWRKEQEKWTEEFRAKQEAERENPIMYQGETAEFLGIASPTLIRYAKAGHIKGEYERGFGWTFRKKEILAFKELILPKLYRRQSFKRGEQ